MNVRWHIAIEIIYRGSGYGEYYGNGRNARHCFMMGEYCSKQMNIQRERNALKDYTNVEDLRSAEKDKGKTKRYPTGTVAKIETVKGNIFYLLALPKFKKIGNKITVDESINMHDYLKCLQNMVDYYSIDGRNLPIYMPTIGCGLSRLYISVDHAVKQLISIWSLNHDKIRNSVHIVVYKKDFWNVHIMKYKK